MLALSLGPAVTLGLVRFAYALLLPAMRDDLDWSYALAGGLNTANAAGYLAGALLAAPIAYRLGVRRSFVVALLAAALALLASALPTVYAAHVVLRIVAGVGGAVAFVSGGVLAAHATSGRPGEPSAATVLGLYYGGGGAGILVSGLAMPALLELGPVEPAAWRIGWVCIGIASLLALVVAGMAARRLPEESETDGGEDGAEARNGDEVSPVRLLAPALAAYFLFGTGYIVYMTFVVAFLMDRGAGALEVSVFWALLGATAAASAPVWAPVIEGLSGGRPLAAVIAVVAVGAILPLVFDGTIAAFASAALFGGSFLAVVTATTALVRHSLPAHAWPTGIAAFTILFATGQCVGPVASGAISDSFGRLEPGLGLSAIILFAGALVALAQRGVRHDV
jgi:predicted MFS family arabinose efflux permease